MLVSALGKTLEDLAAMMLDNELALGFIAKELRLKVLHEALKRTGNNRTRAARMLGMHRNTLTRLLPVEERRAQERYHYKRKARSLGYSKKREAVKLADGHYENYDREHGIVVPKRA
jgi:DNA-binding NtrC family response regulator